MDIQISHRKIGKNQSVFIIAEMSANHLQKFDNAVELIKAAKEAGADAVKLQIYTPDTITIDCNNEYFQIKQGTLWDGQSLYELYKKAYTPLEWQPKLKEIAKDERLICFSSVFNKTSVDFLEEINVPTYKIASFEITDIPLIEYVASKGKPMIIYKGIATLSDIEEAVNACKMIGNDQIALLKCTSAYPAPLEEVNLKTIPNLDDTFNRMVGLSDHSLGISVPIASVVASVALGACIIEKHFTLDKKLSGPDHKASLEPSELKEMVKAIRNIEMALGDGIKKPNKSEIEIMKVARRSLIATRDIRVGEIIKESDIAIKRPGTGILPKFKEIVIGMKLINDIRQDEPFRWENFK